MADVDGKAVEALFERLALAMVGVQANVGFAALSTLIAGQASVCAGTRSGAEEIIRAIASDATAQMQEDFDFFRETQSVPQ
ncbi:hypothetical protein [Brevundimonas sp. NIBR11]|uniref:hypothetical protein n=1 Tax=Brevundimonas sp. NIBR11 TaxID=3015999 RepID=UPI0022F0CA33|nr:hypothetical protein [Brevundimonas sp. NIBR11]WGM31452.1 hypothetical protein KKHFBJBL_01699 [Brevundimonas sp. NIBR11]